MIKQHPAFTRWPWLALTFFALLLLIGVELLVRYEQQRLQAAQLQQHLTIADKLRAQLETQLNIPLYLTVGLASYITAKSGHILESELDILLPGLVRQAQHVRNIGIAPGNRISYIFPLAGNEQALHLYYPDLPDQWPGIADLIAKREARLLGPIQLRQGGMAFVYRYPLFMDDGSYWGIVSTVIDIDPIWQLLTSQAQRANVSVALRSRLAADRFSYSFFGDDKLFTADNLLLNVAIRGADWQMAIAGNHEITARLWGVRTLLYLSCLFVLLLLNRLFYTVNRLQLSSSALSDSEQTLRSIHDNVLDGIITADNQGIIVTANLSCYRIFGYPTGSLPGKHLQQLLSPDSAAEHFTAAKVTALTEQECQGQRANGSYFDVLISHSVLPVHHQYRHLLVLRDITERKRVEKLQSDFVATVSHELRTPLTAIKGTLALAVGGALGALNDKQTKMLHLAQQSCQQLHQLVNDLLDFEKLSGGNMPFTVVALDLVPILEECVAQLTSNQSRTVQLLSDSSPLPQVWADEARLRQVCLNLLSNALKFSTSDTPVQIVLAQQPHCIMVSVIDQGKGVPTTFEPLLFRRFAQASNVAVREQGGTGLGLAICKEIIETLRGQIGYQRLATGSCFYFTLPLQPPADC